MTKSQDIPAAEGTVDVSVGENRNTRLRVDVRHLAAPSQVVGGATVYVVWIRGVEPAASPQNAGALVVDKDLNGRLETVTPLRNFDLYITAEASSMTAAPSGKQLLSAQISRK